ncbi:MAG TPA: hypothetical protein VD978_16445 [Azospirillum sp.]|nr:hypothetical protein [Azospirillum sp.]
MEKTVTTARAAEIVGIGYEGLRSYLKRGLLGSSGLLPPFVAPTAPAPDLSKARAKWTRFGFTDLCLMHLVKQLMDCGLPFEAANGVASSEDARGYFSSEHGPQGAMLLAWPPHYDTSLFSRDDLRHLPDRLAELNELGVVYVLLQLDPVWRHVHDSLQA